MLLSVGQRLSIFLHSIRFRLAAWFLAILGLVILAFSSFIYFQQAQYLRTAALARLDLRTRRVAGLFRDLRQDFFKPGRGSELEMSIDPGSGQAYLQEGDILALISSDGTVLQNWGPVTLNEISPQVIRQLRANKSSIVIERRTNLATAAVPSLATLRVNGSKMRFALSLTPIYDDSYLQGYYLAGTPIDPNNQLPKLRLSLGLGILATLAIAMLGGVWLADRAMRPVKAITQAAQTISETDLTRRLNLKQKDELGLLANTFDEMLDRLQAAFERQRQFTADASHELRTPLTIIDLEAQHALAAPRTVQEYQRVLQVIHSENQYMTRLVNNLLTLARMDAGQVNLKKEKVDLSDIALEVVERLAPLANNRQVRLVAGELPEVLVAGDRQYLVQMLSNLVENAIKYSIQTDGRILVETGCRRVGKDSIAWARVTDNGPGIAAEHLPHLFDRFYRVDQARTRQENGGEQNGLSRGVSESPTYSGTGLGLAIVQWICQAHGGEISVRSEPGQGSVFEVTIPALKDLPQAEPFQPQAHPRQFLRA